MLVLGRKPGQYIMINKKVKVQVIKTDNGSLRLGIDAPREIEIERGEIGENE